MTFIPIPDILKEKTEVIDWEEHKDKCCVVIPVYRKNPVFFEQASIIQCVRILGGSHDICLVAPFGLDLSGYFSLCPGFKFRVKRLAKEFFTGIDAYNELCKRWEFYACFNDYQYMLIYQPDCWIFEDNLEYFMSLDYDYFGAPWVTIEDGNVTVTKCGNGGFSLRKVAKFEKVCKGNASEADNSSVPEDVFFCNKCSDQLNVCPVEIGREFSFEVGPSYFFKLNGDKLPMGCHKPFLFEFSGFWKNYIKF